MTSLGDPSETPIDLGRVQAEINEEVRRRRAAGDFPPGLERELDTMFARYAPPASGDDFDEVLSQAETQSYMHADVPTESTLPGASYVKRGLRKLMAWYLRFVAAQMTAFAGAITRAVRLLSDRVDTLEKVTVLAADRTLSELRERRPAASLGAWTDIVVSELAGAPGRVLHTECGTGDLLVALQAAGTDGYGVEPNEKLVVEASRAGLDVRADESLAHLRALPPDSLGGLVLSGGIDALPLGEVLELADLASTLVSSGGTTVVLSVGVSTDPVVSDLAPGKPLHPETWVHLLGGRGYAVLATHCNDDGSYAVVARRA